MIEQGRAGGIGKVMSGLLAVAAAGVFFLGVNAQAAPVSGQGTWESKLKGRDANGNEINLLNAAGTAPNPDLVIVYDTDRNVTWLADWNVTLTSMTWTNAKNWAEGLAYTIGGVVVDDWVLPSAVNADGTGPCSGNNCTSSLLGHVWYTELGNTASSTGSLTNTGPFSNMQTTRYWSGTA